MGSVFFAGMVAGLVIALAFFVLLRFLGHQRLAREEGERAREYVERQKTHEVARKFFEGFAQAADVYGLGFSFSETDGRYSGHTLETFSGGVVRVEEIPGQHINIHFWLGVFDAPRTSHEKYVRDVVLAEILSLVEAPYSYDTTATVNLKFSQLDEYDLAEAVDATIGRVCRFDRAWRSCSQPRDWLVDRHEYEVVERLHLGYLRSRMRIAVDEVNPQALS